MNAIEILDGMDKVLDEPKKWTQGEYCRTPDGQGTYNGDPEASCFCILGAANKVAESVALLDEYRIAIEAMQMAASELYGTARFAPIANFNDAPSTDYIRVKAVISRARQLLKSHQKENNA